MQNRVYILDSNIWISFMITRRLHLLVALIQDNQLTILTNPHLIEEIREVLARPKFRKYIKQSDVKELIAIHLKICVLVAEVEQRKQLTDTKDDFLLNLYHDGNATGIVTGDKELLHEAGILNYHVMTLIEFETEIRN